VIEEETGAPLEIQAPSSSAFAQSASARPGEAGAEESASAVAANEARLIARDDRKNPLISTFDWTSDATQRIFRVPAGFMRSKTQERIEELARERAAATIDLPLVEEGIEIGKRMMAEMIATYSSSGASPGVATAASSATTADAPAVAPAGNGSGYLNEVSTRPAVTTERRASGEHREA
jgi:Proto-chlorophyllide reductase 57 kD subunit